MDDGQMDGRTDGRADDERRAVCPGIRSIDYVSSRAKIYLFGILFDLNQFRQDQGINHVPFGLIFSDMEHHIAN